MGAPTRAARAAGCLLALATLAGCEVTNPGPVQDEFLNDPSSHSALVNGARRQLLLGANDVFYETAIVARELMPGGNTGAYGFAVRTLFGELPWDVGGGAWSTVHQARWIAEDGIRRFVDENAIPVADRPKSLVLAQAYLWAGYANRVLGEYSCEAVFNGGPAESYLKHFERAEGQFTKALEIATTANNASFKNAALAGRAQVRMWRGDWSNAAADAKLVPNGYVWNLPTDEQNPAYRNGIFFGNAGNPYRSYSVWRTYYHTYYTDTGDPRVTWLADPKFPYANSALPGYGQIPFINQTKYTLATSPYPLAKWQEMRLIEAEALLVAGNVQGAMTIINALRTGYVSKTTGQPLKPWTAANATEAWTVLKRERGIELWLEGRRLGDLRRWKEKNTPGDPELPNFKAVSTQFKDQPDLCRPIPQSERVTNSNLPDTP
jgi:starch-binding outer membrane protein, SusD/RagB family